MKDKGPNECPEGMPSRTQHSSRNALVGILCQGAGMLLAFVGRLVFVHTLGQDYLGISGWFSNILQVLSITELGIGTAIVVSLYKPLAENNVPRIRATLRMLRRAYRYVGLSVLGLGLLVLPFLPVLVNKETTLVDLRIVYLLFLAQSVFSYLFQGYKAALFTADQRQSRIHLMTLWASLFTTTAQIAVLLLWRSYYAYVAIFALAAIFKNLLISRSASRAYPVLTSIARPGPDEDDEAALPKAERRGIFKNLLGLSLYRISGTVLNATDNLVLGKFIGFGIIGVYSNYLLVVTAIATVLTLIFQSLTASVGNLNVTAPPQRQHFVFRCLNLMDGWLYGFSAVCLFCLLDPFITLFFGADWVFADPRVLPIIVLNFLTSGLVENVIMHKDACGLFWQGRFRPVFSAGFNIILSLWWVGPLGIFGVLLATVVSRLITTFWFDPWMVHHYAFQASVKPYALQTAGVLLLTAALCVGLKALLSWLFPALTFWTFAAMVLICAILPNVVFYAVLGHGEAFAYLKEQALGLFKKHKSR